MILEMKNLPKSYVLFVPKFARNVVKNVHRTKPATVKNVPKLAGSALPNAGKWRHKRKKRL